MPEVFESAEGFTRADWTAIAKVIEESVPESDRTAAWTEAAGQWVRHLREDLGGTYGVLESNEFILLADGDNESGRRLLWFAEENVTAIRSHLGELAWRDRPGKQVVLLFGDEDDYYGYLAYFYGRDSIPGSLGMHINSGLPHIAVKLTTELESAQTLAHELTHSCVAHLPIPAWLNEGIAMRLQRVTAGMYAPKAHEGEQTNFWAAMSNWVPPLMWDELAERHHVFWNEENIQSFWAGTSFEENQESQELSYSFAEVLVHLLGENREAFLEFLGRAHFDDAGQTAALDCLGACLGDTAGTFFGEGNWRPLRKAMVDCWSATKKIKDEHQET